MSLNNNSLGAVDVIIVGGGAAGLMCAIEAGQRGRKVVLLENNERAGKKILISGGGRCNFTNLNTTHLNYLTSGSSDFPRSALARFTPQNFLSLVEAAAIPYHEKKLGQLFCDVSSKPIVAMLERLALDASVKIVTGSLIKEVKRQGVNFEITTHKGTWTCSRLVIASGGLSFKNLGATGFAYEVARQFEIPMVEPGPGLVPLTFTNAQSYAKLSGVSCDTHVKSKEKGAQFRENILFTHRGLSGPAILQISSYIKPGETLLLDLIPEQSLKALTETMSKSAQLPSNFLSQYMPARLAQSIGDELSFSKPCNQLSSDQRACIGERVKEWVISPCGTEGYTKAEVTIGGIDTNGLSSKTMEARKVSGLFFIGESVDVTGWLGGYNFQWAWASGFAAGQVV
ncbi:MAG: NAD(P)/FAD-dependent oxidoreductase [Verrucomicrobiota bacterium]|nr:NAD(P)/FAD-dependent oxidoreductase [Verrucomicrobiota bacterium]